MNSISDASSKDLELILEILCEAELSQFFPRIRDELQITKLSHFDSVKIEDLEGIGLSKPASRRLLKKVKKAKNLYKRIKSLIAKFFPSALNKQKSNEAVEDVNSQGVTCLIEKKDLVISSGARLGDGSFGVVRKGQWIMPNGNKKEVAVKVLKQDVYNVPGIMEDFVQEIQAMHSLKHTNLIQLYGIVLSQTPMMVTEIAPLGSLLDYLHRKENKLSIQTLIEYAIQISNGMKYLETKRFIHRDLATRNVLMSATDKLKIGDFGLVRILPQKDECYIMTEQKKVPFPWCAPESLKKKQFSHASDIWMYGVTLWELFTFGEEPWIGLNGQQIIRKIDQGERLECPNSCPSPIYKIMQNSWTIDPSSRPSFHEIHNILLHISIPLLKCLRTFEEEGRLKLAAGDEIIVINGLPDHYWWQGQNQRTFLIGDFARSVCTPLRPLSQQDISKPLPNSLIHAGHGGGDGVKWGDPGFIDDMFLQSPMSPPDMLNNAGKNTRSKTLSVRNKSRGIKKGINYSKFQNESVNKENVKLKREEISDLPEVELISFTDCPSTVRHKSLSASDVNEENLVQFRSHHNSEAKDRPASLLSSYRNVPSTDVLPKRQSFSENQTKHSNIYLKAFNTSSNCNIPVRPAPSVNENYLNCFKSEISNITYNDFNKSGNVQNLNLNQENTKNRNLYMNQENFNINGEKLLNQNEFGNQGVYGSINTDNNYDSDFDDEWDADTNYGVLTDYPANNLYGNQSAIQEKTNESAVSMLNAEPDFDPFDTSNIHIPNSKVNVENGNLMQNTFSTNIVNQLIVNLPPDKNLSNKNLNDQISQMWMEKVSPNSNALSNIKNSAFNSNERNEFSNSLVSLNARKRPLVHESVNASNIQDSQSSLQLNLMHDNLSQSTPSLTSIPETDNELGVQSAFFNKSNNNNLPKLDKSFITELEKNLGKDQASANTFLFTENQINPSNFQSQSNFSKNIIQNDFNQTLPKTNCHLNFSSNFNSNTSNSNSSACNMAFITNASLNSNSGVATCISTAPSTNLILKTSNNAQAFKEFDFLSATQKLGLTANPHSDLHKFFQKPAEKNFTHNSVNITPTSLPVDFLKKDWSLEQPKNTLNNFFPKSTSIVRPNFYPNYNSNITTSENTLNSNMIRPNFNLNSISSNLNVGTSYHEQQFENFCSQHNNLNTHFNPTRNSKTQLSLSKEIESQCENKITTNVIQPNLVLNPQLSINYNQVVCSSGAAGGGDGANSLISKVASMVPGTKLEAAKQALQVASGDYVGAVQFLKEDKLYRLGMANKLQCREILEKNNWELEISASVLLDKFSS